ncbi:MAG: PaaI family thioesterase [Cryomorphaceae bacterium]|nr:PaaI family thioesterase [Flavobacteriales bacterium]
MNKSEILERANSMNKNTLMETLNIEYTDIGSDFVKAKMPVTPKVHQPAGLLHGGANAALAESVGSLGSFVILNDPKIGVVGIEVNANHIKSIKSGYVYAEGSLLHAGKSTHVWEIKIKDGDGNLLSVCRLTNMIIRKG